MNIVGILIDRYCETCGVDSTAEVVTDLGGVVLLQLTCCDASDEMESVELNEHLADCGA
jgi:hypothetical protein